jgi:hypothetical protein
VLESRRGSLESRKGAHEAVQGVLGGYIDGGREEGALACDGRDVRYAAWLLAGQEVRDCQLGYADRVRDVDVDEGVAG